MLYLLKTKPKIDTIIVIAGVWFIASFVLDLVLAGANDSDLDTKMSVYVWFINAVCKIIFFPMCYIQNWTGSGMSRSNFFLGMFFNSLFWGWLLAFLFHILKQFFTKK